MHVRPYKNVYISEVLVLYEIQFFFDKKKLYTIKSKEGRKYFFKDYQLIQDYRSKNNRDNRRKKIAFVKTSTFQDWINFFVLNVNASLSDMLKCSVLYCVCSTKKK